MKVFVTLLCPTLCDPVVCSPSVSSIHEILQARVLRDGVGSHSFSRGSSQHWDWTQVSPALQADFLPPEPPGRFITFWFTCKLCSFQFSLVSQSCLTLCNPMECSTPDFPVHHQLPELAQTHVHWVGDAIQPSHPLLSPSPPIFNLSQHQGLF